MCVSADGDVPFCVRNTFVEVGSSALAASRRALRRNLTDGVDADAARQRSPRRPTNGTGCCASQIAPDPAGGTNSMQHQHVVELYDSQQSVFSFGIPDSQDVVSGLAGSIQCMDLDAGSGHVVQVESDRDGIDVPTEKPDA